MLYSVRLSGPASSGSASNSASVYGCRGAAKTALVVACSTISPPYMTATLSVWPPITPRSCVTRITAMPSWCRRSSMSSRISRWIVTSSEVVGSSAMSSRGSQASAAAIIARCRMPPDSSCGYCPATRCGSGIRTNSSTSTARAAAACASAPRCTTADSAICRPTVIVGLSELDGSWKTMPMSLPRIWCIC